MSDNAGNDGELRKRAAWLLGMLVLAAVLVVIVATTLLRGGSGGGSPDANPTGPGVITNTGPPSGSPSSSHSDQPTSGTPSSSASSSSSAPGSATCPTSAACALDGDVGNAAAAITAYLQAHNKPAVPVQVADDAKACALRRGDGCSGGWAETEVPAPADGTLAVSKISQFAKFTSTTYKSIDIGWAYDPGSKTYYFVTIRQG